MQTNVSNFYMSFLFFHRHLFFYIICKSKQKCLISQENYQIHLYYQLLNSVELNSSSIILTILRQNLQIFFTQELSMDAQN